MLSTLSKISLAFACLCISLTSHALIVGTYRSPPFSMLEDDEYIGLATEVIQELLKESGISDYQIMEYPLARGLVELEYSRIDILYPYLTHLKKHNQQYILIGPISKYSVALFVRKDYAAKVSLAAMKDLVLGAERGSISQTFLAQHNIKVEQSTHEISCLKMVLAERITACAMGTLPGMYAAAINDIYDKLRYVQTNLSADIYVALSPNLSPEIVAKLQNAYKKLKQENYFELKQKDYENKFKIFIKSLA